MYPLHSYLGDESRLLEEIAQKAAIARIQQSEPQEMATLSSSPKGSHLDPIRGGLPSTHNQYTPRVPNSNSTAKGVG